MTMQGEELKALRKATGMTQADFGTAMGLSRVSIGLMERGEAPIERRTILAARYLAEHPEAAVETGE